MNNDIATKKIAFSGYQIFIIAILAIIQFSVILDFMVLSPLGFILFKELKLSPSEFGWVVSSYAFSAAFSGLLAAGFADKYDRKKMLLFFYAGFILGTLLCGFATNYISLLTARIVTGFFGGVIGSIGFAIITDLFKMETRGRVMGFVQMAFAASQILGIPAGLWLANHYNWHWPFFMIVGFSVVVYVIIALYMKPVTEHLKVKSNKNAFQHLAKVLSQPSYQQGFLATVLLATGGFMMMPFASIFSTNNMGISQYDLPLMYGITGAFSIVFGPIIGKLADKSGKFNVFVGGSLISIIMIIIYTHLGITPFWEASFLSVLLFVGISSRMISSSALLSGVPEQQDRGAFMSINAAIQQVSGGIASVVAGVIVVQQPNGKLERYDILGYVVAGSAIVTIYMMHLLNEQIKRQAASKSATAQKAPQSPVQV